MNPRAWASINLAALKHNLSVAKAAAPNSKLLAVIKADGYGHGIQAVARALGEADGFGVACLQEAVMLREAGVEQTILLLEGVFSFEELQLVRQYNLSIVVHQLQQIEWLEQLDEHDNDAIPIWLKLDSGMHRLGFSESTFMAAKERLQRCAALSGPITAISHFANADRPEHPVNDQQLSLFDALATDFPQKSMANSAALLALPQSHYDWVRPGIMLFGSSPFLSGCASQYQLRPVMTLKARLFEIKSLKKGDVVGYGGSWVCPHEMRIGLVSIGYGDGYPRHAPNGTPVLIGGHTCSLVGRVSMDMISVDLQNHPDAQCGDQVVLWGEGLAVDEVADAAGTISYELLCGITSRVEFAYLDSEQGE